MFRIKITIYSVYYAPFKTVTHPKAETPVTLISTLFRLISRKSRTVLQK